MKLGIMQPYFFPYLGYFDLINYSDKWVVFDTVQYIRHGWVNRNRILHPKEGWQYIIVPLKKHGRGTTIHDIMVSDASNWQGKILGQVQHYKKTAPFFNEISQLIKDCITTGETSLSRVNVSILSKLCNYMEIQFEHCFFSEMDLELDDIKEPGDWALQIAEAMNASEYVNPPAGAELFDLSKFGNKNIKLTIRKTPPFPYSCRGYDHIPDLSIIDVLMWNRPEAVKRHLEQYKTKTE